jgi:cytochrome c biogenesis protein CcmG/thiol:disulfide interchange protein DsbE
MLRITMTEPSAPVRRSLPLWVIFTAGVVLLGFLILLGMSLAKSQTQSLKVGSPVTDFSLTTFDGQTLSLSSLRGKTVLINFWASWCTTCTDEAAFLQQAWQGTDQQQFVFLGVDYADTDAPARTFLRAYGVTYPTGPDLGSSISQQFHVTGVPETYLIDGEGVLRGVQIGPFTSLEEIQTFIAQSSGN